MKKCIVVIAIILCVCAFLLWRGWRPAEKEAPLPVWYTAYEDFLTEKRYLEEGQDFGTEISPFISLHDLDGDGVPELSMTNGYTGRAVRCAYLYSCIDGNVTYLGIGPSDSFHAPDTAFTGLFGYFQNSVDSYSWTYYWKDGGQYGCERICLVENGEYTEKTDNDSLFALVQQKEKLAYIADVSLDSVEEMGWSAFAEDALEELAAVEEEKEE